MAPAADRSGWTQYDDPAVYRVYARSELGPDGYPPIWHTRLKHEVRERAGHRCVRCKHPYVTKAAGGEMMREVVDGKLASVSLCDDECTHPEPIHVLADGRRVAVWRILTVHHLDGDKANCRWWNLVALCQRCHLRVQRVVQMQRVYVYEHSAWFQPYVAGFYAFTYLGVYLSRAEVEARLDELLALERVA